MLSDQNDTSIKVVRFNGSTKSDFISRKEFESGCILKQMEEALEYTLNVLNIIQTHVVGGTRIDTPYFDGIAFREAWYNAVCHNLWVEHIPPAIYGFDNRIEIISQGVLKSGMTQEEFFAGVSKPINEEFAKIFMQMHYMEQSGRGVPTVISRYGEQAYRFGSSFIQCVFPYNIVDAQKNNKLTGKDVGVNVGVKLTKTEKKVLALISEKEEMTANQMARVVQVTTRTIERALKSLKEKGYLVRRGTDKVGYWEVILKDD